MTKKQNSRVFVTIFRDLKGSKGLQLGTEGLAQFRPLMLQTEGGVTHSELYPPWRLIHGLETRGM